jgi:hypothetical protein
VNWASVTKPARGALDQLGHVAGRHDLPRLLRQREGAHQRPELAVDRRVRGARDLGPVLALPRRLAHDVLVDLRGVELLGADVAEGRAQVSDGVLEAVERAAAVDAVLDDHVVE